tara:strand:+ start:56 stop:232 length:177 start_codon:yes stop_codon:yes gene_type:complete
MVLGGAMAAAAASRALAVQALSAAGVQCSLAAAWRQALLLLNETEAPAVTKRLSVQRK